MRITYEDSADDAHLPQSLFFKLCGPGSTGEGTNKEFEDIGRQEVEFYREVAPRMPCPPLVRCFDAAYSEETRRSHILLEDLSETHSQPPEGIAPSEEMSRLAVAALGRAHAHWWGRSTSSIPPLVKARSEFDLRKFTENLNESVHEFLVAARLSEVQKDAYRQMLGAADRIWGRMTRPDHLTITHGDMHWWNFLYPNDPRADSVRVFDWHLWHADLGARDLAFLLALGGFAAPRPSLEEDLLRVYHKALGIADYSWEMLVEDYRWSAIRNLNIPVIFWKQGKHYSTWQDALRRGYDAYERLNCGELL